jgi:hypothetical protein
MKKLARIALSAIVALALALTLAPPAAAAPLTNYFTAYDFRYETPYNCGTPANPEWVCYAVPTNNGASYFNAPTLTRSWIYDSIGGRTNSHGYVTQPGQNNGIMCWKTATNGAIWLLEDTRQWWTTTSTALVTGWVPDADVQLSRTDRLAYVAECGYILTIAQ